MKKELYALPEWQERYRKMSAIVDRIYAMKHQRMVKLCKEAGLDSSIMGIHIHNAWVARETGKPWPGVNYSKVRLLRRLEQDWRPSRILDAWDKRVRGIA